MKEAKRHHNLLGLFLFVAVIFGFAATMLGFQTALPYLHKAGKYGDAARLSLLDSIINISFSLFLLSFVASYRRNKEPSSLMDILGFALFLRVLIIVFFVFHLFKIEGVGMTQLKFRYISLSNYLFGGLQALCMLFALIGMGTSDGIEEEEGTGRGGVPSIDSYLPTKVIVDPYADDEVKTAPNKEKPKEEEPKAEEKPKAKPKAPPKKQPKRKQKKKKR